MPAQDFYRLTGNINSLAEAIQSALDSGQSARNPKSISSPMGELIALLTNLRSPDKKISCCSERILLALYGRIAATVYTGEELSFTTHVFHRDDPLEDACYKDLRHREGWKNSPERVLELQIDGRICGTFVPECGCFLPSAGFRDTEIDGLAAMDYLKTHPEVCSRCRAILTDMIANGSDRHLLLPILSHIGGFLNEQEMEVYRAESMVVLPQDVSDYILAAAPQVKVPGIACGFPGINSGEKLLENISLVYAGEGALIHYDMQAVGGGLVALSPVCGTDAVSEVSFTMGGKHVQGSLTLPEWIEYTAKLDGILYHRVYPVPTGGWRIYGVDSYIDLAYKVPDGILSRYNYLVRPTEQPSVPGRSLNCSWRTWPKDDNETMVTLHSIQYKGDHWKVCQRSLRIDRLELLDLDGNILASIFPEKAPAFHRNVGKKLVAIDPAGTDTVRLESIINSMVSGPVCYKDLVHPLTPLQPDEFHGIVKKSTYPADNSADHIDALVQTFDTTDAGFEKLMVTSRVWKADPADMFAYLVTAPQNMVSAMSNLGVIANPKEMLAREDLSKESLNECEIAMRHYIGFLLLESICAEARKGYSIAGKNLEFVLSYPENGSGEGVTQTMKEAIEGAIELVNKYLDYSGMLVTGTNVSLYSESEASAQWHKNNPPDNQFMADTVAAGTPDYGHSTHDFSFRAGGNHYLFSLPYAGQYITNATLAKVFSGNASGLVDCFTGSIPGLRKPAINAISAAMTAGKGKTYESLGYVLPLTKLFKECTFQVTGPNANADQQLVQQLVEARLNVAVPAYADAIVRALRDGVLSPDSQILIAPVGMASLALCNTSTGFEGRFEKRIIGAIEKQSGQEFKGRILLLSNNDPHKESVAQGLIYLKQAGATAKTSNIRRMTEEELLDHYLDLAYGQADGSQNMARAAKKQELDEAAKSRASIADYNVLRKKLYEEAFRSLMAGYSSQDFVDSFNCWGYVGTMGGLLDQNIRKYAVDNFGRLMAVLQATRKNLIMSCPGCEKEMVCSVMIDLVIESMPLAELTKKHGGV